MEEISCIDYSIENIENIKKRKSSFQPVLQNKKRKISNEINILTYNFDRLKLKRKADTDEYAQQNKKIKLSNDIIINNSFIPIEKNVKRKSDQLEDNQFDNNENINKKIKINELEIKEDNILNCKCIRICRCDYDYEYFKENNKRLPPDDLIYRYII